MTDGWGIALTGGTGAMGTFCCGLGFPYTLVHCLLASHYSPVLPRMGPADVPVVAQKETEKAGLLQRMHTFIHLRFISSMTMEVVIIVQKKHSKE